MERGIAMVEAIAVVASETWVIASLGHHPQPSTVWLMMSLATVAAAATLSTAALLAPALVHRSIVCSGVGDRVTSAAGSAQSGQDSQEDGVHGNGSFKQAGQGPTLVGRALSGNLQTVSVKAKRCIIQIE
jgi:hypothetical protein